MPFTIQPDKVLHIGMPRLHGLMEILPMLQFALAAASSPTRTVNMTKLKNSLNYFFDTNQSHVPKPHFSSTSFD